MSHLLVLDESGPEIICFECVWLCLALFIEGKGAFYCCSTGCMWLFFFSSKNPLERDSHDRNVERESKIKCSETTRHRSLPQSVT